MNKLVPVLSVVLAGSVLVAVMIARDSQHQRARADALAERLLELEPVERNTAILPEATARVRSAVAGAAKRTVEPLAADVPASHAPGEAKAAMELTGTLRARKQVEDLQSALASATPLQDYQTQALINAIDDVHRELEQKSAGAQRAEGDAKLNERIIQVASDILFESQLEVLIELLEAQDKAQK